ncbi:IS4 family transposase [Bacteroides sp.]
MALFNQKIDLKEILRQIPEEELMRISKKSGVDRYAKVLSGKLMFYLLLLGILRTDKLSQRGLSDSFSSPLFRTLFNIKGKKTLSHSSISERLSTMDVDFFRITYETIYKIFSSLYNEREISKLCLQRVDSSLVVESCNKLRQGMTCGNEYGKKKMMKYTINYDGFFPSFCSVHSAEKYANESLALPVNVLDHFKKTPDHSTVYVFDRGQSSAESFKEMSKQNDLRFVGHLIENRKLDFVEDLKDEEVEFAYGELLEDKLVRLYKRQEVLSKTGKVSRRQVLVDEVFRVIRFHTPKGKELLLITNCLDLSASEIAGIYHRRWDIEVFFRFIKQELNFSHFLSLNENGIQIVLYMTMITAMLVMIYKRKNDIRYTAAVRRMGIELECLVMAIIVIESGGDLKKTELGDP